MNSFIRYHTNALHYPRSNLARAAVSRSIRDVVLCVAPTSARSLTTDKVGIGDAGGGAPQPTAEAALAVLRLLDAIPIVRDAGVKDVTTMPGKRSQTDGIFQTQLSVRQVALTLRLKLRASGTYLPCTVRKPW